MVNEWVAWAWVIAVDLAVVTAVIASLVDGTRTAALRPQHVAGAAILGVGGWETAAGVAGSLAGRLPGSGADLALLFGQTTFAVAAAAVVVGIVGRRRWAVVLGIGLAIARAILAGVAAFDVSSIGGDLGPETLRSTLLFIGLSAVPFVVAAWLFVDPFRRGELRWSRDVAPAEDQRGLPPA